MDESKKLKWRKQIKNAITCLENLQTLSKIRTQKKFNEITEKWPVMISPYYYSLINQSDLKNDPVARQCIPDARELENSKFHNDDPLGERRNMPFPFLIHRYRDRAVLLATSRCAVHCRFCFRKRIWKNKQSDINDSELESACRYLTEHREIKEVLVSGGDPLMLENERLEKILQQLHSVPNIEILRLGTRIPVVLPMRINRKLMAILKKFTGLWVATHFNHPAEVTEQSIKACKTFINAGIPVINQTVLLSEINDQADILENLFRKLVKIGVKPHYLYHVDPAEGNAHFVTGIDRGISLIREFRQRLSSLATPVFAIDLPEGGGKVPLQPNYCQDGCFETTDGRTVKYYGSEL